MIRNYETVIPASNQTNNKKFCKKGSIVCTHYSIGSSSLLFNDDMFINKNPFNKLKGPEIKNPGPFNPISYEKPEIISTNLTPSNIYY